MLKQSYQDVQQNIRLDWTCFSIESLYIEPLQPKVFNTGIKIKLPPLVYGRIAPRSGMALAGIDVGGGVIDADYTGEIKVILNNLSKKSYHIDKHQKIAQLICEKYIAPIICETKLFTQFAFRNDAKPIPIGVQI